MNGPHGPLPAPAAEAPKWVCVPGCTETDPRHVVCKPPSEPVAPSLLPRVLAALETLVNRGAAFYLAQGELRTLAAELRRYIAEMEGTQKDPGGHADECATYVASLRSGLEREIARRNADIDEVRTSLIAAYTNREWGAIRSVLARIAARTAARSEGES